MTKTPPGNFKVTTLENPLLSKQVVTSKAQYLIPTYSWTLSPRGVHGSGRVGFVPNPDSTRHYRVGKISTRNRPTGSFRSPGRVASVFGCKSVGFGFSDSLVFGRNLAGSCQIWPDLTRVGRDSFGSMKIWLRFGWVGVGLTGVLVEFE